jgi:predicted Abi (CAAX) family protease
MKDNVEITAAKSEVERSRARLMETAHELQERLSPKKLTRDAWQGAKEKGAGLAEDAVVAVRARPVAATGAVAALTLFLAREPLMDLARKLMGVASKKRTPRKSRKTKPSQTEAVE